MMQQLDSVTLTRDLPKAGRKAGARGAITDVYEDEGAYMVEFFDEDGETIALEHVDRDSLRLTRLDERPPRQMRGVAKEQPNAGALPSRR